MRLIDADALAGRILMDAPGFMDGGSEITKAFILAMIKTRSATPTVDAIPVIRCKDCKHRDPEDHKCNCGHDIYWQMPRENDWFCADGERKDDSGL